MTLPIPINTYFSYNGFTFPSNVKTKVTEEPVTSGDNRTVKWSKLTLSTSGWFTQAEADSYATSLLPIFSPAGATLDKMMLAIRRKLQVHGKALRYVNKGYGLDLNINSTAIMPPAGAGDFSVVPSIRDVAMGPKAGKLVWWPLGGVPDGCHGAGFQWDVTTCIAECGAFQIAPNKWVEISFTVSYETGHDGLVTITYHGVAQIPMSLNAANVMDFNVDSQIQNIIRPVPVGFLRSMSRQLSADRTACTFTITDKQIEVPYPNDVVHIDMKHRVRQSVALGPKWDCSLTGTVRISPTASKIIGWRRFWNIVAQRMNYIRSVALINTVIPGTVEFEEDLFKNESRFTINFRMMNTNFANIVWKSGLWRPIVNNDNNRPPDNFSTWTAETWRDSLSNNAQAVKGYLGATFSNSNEIIIDICAGPRVGSLRDIAISQVVSPATDESDEKDLVDLSLTKMFGGLEAEDLDELYPPESSWLAWECYPERVIDHNQIRHKPLSGTVRMTTPRVDPFGNAALLASDVTAPRDGWTATTPDIVQQTASPSFVLRLTGFAVRMGRRVNPPKLITYGGQPATLRHERTRERTMGIAGAIKAYRTDWVLEYLIPGPTGATPLLADPLLGTDGTAQATSTGPLQTAIAG